MAAERSPSHFDLSYGEHFDLELTLREIGFSALKMWHLNTCCDFVYYYECVRTRGLHYPLLRPLCTL